MSHVRLRAVASAALVVGAALGLAGTFMSSASLRGLAWGVDGVALVVAGVLLGIHHLRRGHDFVAAGYLVFAVGEVLVLSSAAMDLVASTPLFGAGTGLWAASLALVSVPRVLPPLVRGVGLFASMLFAIVALQIFAGRAITPLTAPLPFFAYPFLVLTLLGWAWAHWRTGVRGEAGS